MKRATITFKDEDMLQGAKDAAQEQGISFSEYATSLIGLDLQLRLQYKIIAFYDDGTPTKRQVFILIGTWMRAFMLTIIFLMRMSRFHTLNQIR